MSKVIVKLTGAAREYGSGEGLVKALSPTDLEIKRGEFACVAGPSGSGKTTLLNLAGLIDKPTTGEVEVMGKATVSLSKGERANIRRDTVGFVFQTPSLLPVLTAWENIEYALILRGIPPGKRTARVERLLKEVGLSDKATKRPSELSGGEQQRIAVARALAPSPPLVIADEPTANLDSVTGGKLLELLHTLADEEGTAFLLSSHDPLVITSAKRVLFLRDGVLNS